MRFSDLTAGYEFPPAALALDETTVRDYLAATGDDDALYWQDETPAVSAATAPVGAPAGALHIVPPLAVAALSFRGLAQGLALEPGSLHTGQELAFRRPVRVGELLTTNARVATSSRRRGFTALMIDLTASDDMGEEALTGRMTLMVAGAEGGDLAASGEPTIQTATELALAAPEPVTYAPLGAGHIVAGQEIAPLTRTVTQERINAYARASGDYNPIHLDPLFAARTPFGGTIAHGMLLLSYISTALTRAFGRAWLNSGGLKVRFRNPASAGTTVSARGRVERVEEGDGVHYAVCAVLLENAAGEALITGEARVHVPRQ